MAAFALIGYIAYLQKAQRNNRNQQANIQSLAKKNISSLEAQTASEAAPNEEKMQEDRGEKDAISEDKPNLEETPIHQHVSEHNPPLLPSHPQETPSEKRKRVKKNWIWGDILRRDL